MEETSREERRRLRSRAVRALVEHPSLGIDDVRVLRACEVRMHGASGRLYLELRRSERCVRTVHLSWHEGQCVLEWLEEERSWGADVPVFRGRRGRPLTRDGWKSLLRRLREDS